MSFFYDGLTQPAEDPNFNNINLGAGGSGQIEAIMTSGDTGGDNLMVETLNILVHALREILIMMRLI